MFGSFRKRVYWRLYRLALKLGIRPDPGSLVESRIAEQLGILTLGKHSYGNPSIRHSRGDCQSVTIGNYCSIALGVEIFIGGNHPVEWVSTFPFRIRFGLEGAYEDGSPGSNGDVSIGHDVWIGVRATILSGVTINHGAVIAAGSVVTKDVPAFTIVGGNPATEIRRRFTDSQIEALLDIEWWNWSTEAVIESVSLLSSDSIDVFIDKFGGT